MEGELLSTLGLIALLIIQGDDAALEPVSFRHVMKDYGDVLGEGDTPLQWLGEGGDSIDAVFRGEISPLGKVYVVILSVDAPGLPGFAAYRDSEGTVCRTDFRVIGDYGWWLDEFQGMTASDIDGDGFGDLEIEASYITGIGPDGVIPFAFNSILLWSPGEQEFAFDCDLSN